jgi:hypothetical protein
MKRRNKPQIARITQMMKAKGLPPAETAADVDKRRQQRIATQSESGVISEICGSNSAISLRIECLHEGIKFGLELALAFLDDFQLQLVAMQLDCRMVNMAFNFSQLGLALVQRTL